MQTAECPHCRKPIEIISAKDLDDDYGISPNALQHAREKDEFPEPWLEFANRNIWLKSVIDEYASRRTHERVSKRVQELHALLDTLPEQERDEIVAALKSSS